MARIAMIVGNPCNPDNRVIKEAEALAANGHIVRIFCTAKEGLPERTTRNSVGYTRLGKPAPARVAPPFKAAAVPEPTGAVKELPTLSHRIHQRSLTELRRLRRVARFALSLGKLALHRSTSLTLRPLQLLNKFAKFRDLFAPAVAAWQPDIVHAHDLYCLPAGALAAKRARARLVYDSHELETHRNPPMPRMVRFAAAVVEQRLIRRADAVITVSHSIADHLRDEYSIKRPHVIFNAPVIGEPSQAPRDIRADAGVPAGMKLGVYVGLVTMNRGVETLVDALTQLPDVMIAAVGPVNPKLIGSIRARAKQAGVADRFKLLPAVPPEEVVAYVAGADFGLNPLIPITLSYQYAMPNKLFEMALAGLPIVNSDAADSARFVRENGLGVIFQHSNPVSCAAAIEGVCANLDMFKPTSERLAELRDQFGWSRQAQALNALYDRMRIPAPSSADVRSAVALAAR